MATEIKRISNDVFMVNGIEVFLDTNNKFVAKGVLVTSEIKDFQMHLKAINYQKKNRFKKNPFDLAASRAKLAKIDKTIENISIQLGYLNEKENPLSEEAIVLRSYYTKKIKDYENVRNETINNIPVSCQDYSVNKSESEIQNRQ